MHPVPYLLKVASGEVRPRYKVVPLNETKNFCLNDIFVGLHLLAGHRFEVRRFVKECVRANLCAPPNLFSERGLSSTRWRRPDRPCVRASSDF